MRCFLKDILVLELTWVAVDKSNIGALPETNIFVECTNSLFSNHGLEAKKKVENFDVNFRANSFEFPPHLSEFVQFLIPAQFDIFKINLVVLCFRVVCQNLKSTLKITFLLLVELVLVLLSFRFVT